MAFTKINWKPTPKDLRLFGTTLLAVTLVIGSLFYLGGQWLPFFDRPEFGKVLRIFGGLAFLTGITGTCVAYPIYYLWMSIVFIISSILGYSLLGLIFFLIIFPISIVSRITGRDRLKLKKKTTETYWVEPTGKTNDLSRQF